MRIYVMVIFKVISHKKLQVIPKPVNIIKTKQYFKRTLASVPNLNPTDNTAIQYQFSN